MTKEERERALDDLKAEVQSAAQEINAGEVVGCCNRLVDAFLLLSQFLEKNP